MTPNELTREEMRRRREELGLTRVDLAVKMGSTSSRVARMETKGFLSVEEQRSVFEALAGPGWSEEPETVDPHAWLAEARPGDEVIVIIGDTWVRGRYRLGSVRESTIDVIDQRNGGTRSFRPENVRPA